MTLAFVRPVICTSDLCHPDLSPQRRRSQNGQEARSEKGRQVIMRNRAATLSLFAALGASTFTLSTPAEAAVRVGVSVRVPAPPHVRVVAVAPVPRPAGVVTVRTGPVWVSGHYTHHGVWVPGHWRY